MSPPPAQDPSSSGSLPLGAIAELHRILIVEDNDEARRELVAHFVARDWQVEATRTLREALAIASRQVPHVIVTELSLPDVRGFFAAQLRRALPSRVAILALTRMPSMIFDAARKAGFDEVLSKPVDMHMLYAQVHAFVTQPVVD